MQQNEDACANVSKHMQISAKFPCLCLLELDTIPQVLPHIFFFWSSRLDGPNLRLYTHALHTHNPLTHITWEYTQMIQYSSTMI
ncbi:uncharacterized protein DS421_9g256000 [Arachis hypogaea]|nr:uncharacterized protein DS421_9g256000 [Arachis hypogaea]